MKLLRGINWKTLGLELFIVFIGLLAALQVDEWRENRQYHDAETRYLQRLDGDLERSIESLVFLKSMVEGSREGVRQVDASLAAGEIVDGNTELFERGLLRVGHLPSPIIYRSAYDEMVASGMFARLRSEELKQSIAGLIAVNNMVESNFSWWRTHPVNLGRQIMPYVEFGYGEGTEVTGLGVVERKRTVTYDFDALRNDPVIRNQFYWAVDTHEDWHTWFSELLSRAETAKTIVEAELATR